jgi:hypothetical protein
VVTRWLHVGQPGPAEDSTASLVAVTAEHPSGCSCRRHDARKKIASAKMGTGVGQRVRPPSLGQT